MDNKIKGYVELASIVCIPVGALLAIIGYRQLGGGLFVIGLVGYKFATMPEPKEDKKKGVKVI